MKLVRVPSRLSLPSAAVLALVASVLASPAAQAAIDTSAATGGVSDAATAIGLVLAGMITLAAMAYGLKKVIRLLGS